MKIDEVKICNWRSIREMTIKAQDLMIIIGQNNHGKSNIISAVLFFFGELKNTDLDFHNENETLFVEIKFSELDEFDRTTFKKYLTAYNEIRVRKTAYKGGSFEYAGYLQNPLEESLKESNASNFTKRETAESQIFKDFLPKEGRIKKEDIVNAQQEYIKHNFNSLTFNYEIEDSPFLGLKSVASSIFGNIYYLPALKDAKEDFNSKESSIFSRLYVEIIRTMAEKNPNWQNAKIQLNSIFSILNALDEQGNINEHRPTEFTDFEKLLSDELLHWNTRACP